MEVQSPATAKRHYDITMSRRTRKQQQQKSDTNTTKDVPKIETSNLPNDHKSLKQLILGEEKDPMKNKNNSNGNNHEGERGNKGKNNNSSSSLGEHFNEEEKQLQLVKIQQKDNIQGLKFKKLVSRYAKVLGHLMKAKRDPHLGETAGKKKPLFKLSK